jgi:hypothetical protein
MTSARGANNVSQVNMQSIATENMGFLNNNELPIDTPQTIDPNSNTVFYRNDDPNMRIQDIDGKAYNT